MCTVSSLTVFVCVVVAVNVLVGVLPEHSHGVDIHALTLNVLVVQPPNAEPATSRWWLVSVP
eukprot:scaffold1373_cov367-Pinguiococcus_pyrenoidosus.AAC.20